MASDVASLTSRSSATRFSADIGLVNLNLSVQHGLLSFDHRGADAVAEIPRGLVAHPDCALHLAGGHSLLGFAEQMRGQEPFGEREMRIVEHGAGCDGELVVAILAIEELLFGFQFDRRSLAAQATRAFWEAQAHEKLAALIFGAKQRVDIN